MPTIFAEQVSHIRNYEDALDLLEKRLNEYGQSGFAYWTFPIGMYDPETKTLDPEEHPVHVVLRGPTFLKAAELLYFNNESYRKDETVIAACERA